jgi:transposase-like protein
MRYLQYKGLVEREYKKSLKKVMHELCVEQGLTASEGAKKLGIAKEVFAYWQRYYRFDQRQMLFDQTVKDLERFEELYADEAKTADFSMPLQYEKEESVKGLEELIERMIGYYKFLHFKTEGLSAETAKLPLYEFSYDVVVRYRNGSLLQEVKEKALAEKQ